ncbi:transcriptional regulator [Xenorhabdus vietnamensis]|uniref:Transcriptional regulator n=1 Tax=Xenorhabdus vietnamensis TaxID=351656 RepID=A0A1Y2SAV3_9GAMM|nr:FMN-binding negative transcriptional regulator [Xenorhabdus vietnamensis]OTA14660.1 transcriptional regulator [Xenorhabdus vietnamensis]
MYIPHKMKMTEKNNITECISIYSFGLLVSVSSSFSLTGTHTPFVLNPNEGEHGVLYDHAAKTNPHWKELTIKTAFSLH